MVFYVKINSIFILQNINSTALGSGRLRFACADGVVHDKRPASLRAVLMASRDAAHCTCIKHGAEASIFSQCVGT